MEDARATLGAANCGVPLIASAHARSIPELMERPAIRLLHRAHVFDKYVSPLRRAVGGFDCKITDWQDACKGERVC
jgi:stage III sporulation protein SpoIIIAA